jgi:hypothetical protein
MRPMRRWTVLRENGRLNFEERAVKYIVVLDATTPVGTLMLAMHRKIGGASETIVCGVTPHPAIYCSAIDWGSAPSFARLTHLANPPDEASARELVVPCRCILFVTELKADAAGLPDQSGAGQTPVKH